MKPKETRSYLEEQFSRFEKSLIQELNSVRQGQDSPPVILKVEEKIEPVQIPCDHDQEILKMRAALSEAEEKNRSLEDTVAKLRESLKLTVVERQKLSGQIRALEEDLKKASVAQSDGESGWVREKEELLGKIAFYKAKRKHSAEFWRRWSQAYHSVLHPMESQTHEAPEDPAQVTQLNAELDSAMELIAELRDEFNSVGKNPARSRNI